jgi:hypothetical protein
MSSQTSEKLTTEGSGDFSTEGGGGFQPPQKIHRISRASQAAEKLSEAAVLKGHGFIRANKSNKMAPALAAEGWFFAPRLEFRVFPQPVQPRRNIPYQANPNPKSVVIQSERSE